MNPTSTTPSPGSTTPSPQSTANPTQAPSTGGKTGQHFDAASFIGGIVLCAGLAAIAYFGFKFYKARTERNYHTL
ncbi:hypothetical protein V1264_016228 [Littorina saxatilis]|uniref:Uncharacterized protein n=2 Tax=Littorina saxatilis TaxID=31220 RepID=A0AAN9BNM2_9CAEN